MVAQVQDTDHNWRRLGCFAGDAAVPIPKGFISTARSYVSVWPFPGDCDLA